MSPKEIHNQSKVVKFVHSIGVHCNKIGCPIDVLDVQKGYQMDDHRTAQGYVVSFDIFILSENRETCNYVLHALAFSPALSTFFVYGGFQNFGFEIGDCYRLLLTGGDELFRLHLLFSQLKPYPGVYFNTSFFEYLVLHGFSFHVLNASSFIFSLILVRSFFTSFVPGAVCSSYCVRSVTSGSCLCFLFSQLVVFCFFCPLF